MNYSPVKVIYHTDGVEIMAEVIYDFDVSQFESIYEEDKAIPYSKYMRKEKSFFMGPESVDNFIAEYCDENFTNQNFPIEFNGFDVFYSFTIVDFSKPAGHNTTVISSPVFDPAHVQYVTEAKDFAYIERYTPDNVFNMTASFFVNDMGQIKVFNMTVNECLVFEKCLSPESPILQVIRKYFLEEAKKCRLTQ